MYVSEWQRYVLGSQPDALIVCVRRPIDSGSLWLFVHLLFEIVIL